MNKKYDIEKARKIFEEQECQLLESKYKNCSTPMKYKCSCGKISKISLTDFKVSPRCRKCWIDKMTFSYEYVYNYFLKNGCVLLSKKYSGSTQKLKYKCSCNNISEIEFKNFKYGTRCRACSSARANETNRQNHNGKLYLQTKEFLKKREETYLKKYGVTSPLKNKSIMLKMQNTNLKRYGVKYVTMSAKIKKRQIKGVFKKYGYKYIMQVPEIKKKFKETLMKRYGVPSLAHLSNCASKESQKVFWEIHNSLPKDISHKNHFAKLNAEFVANRGKQYFKYDFVNTKLKKAIEYNGYNFHPKPEQDESEIGWCVFHPNKTVKEARKYEDIKYSVLEERGYKILTLWDREYKKNPKESIKKCIDFLLT